MSRFRDLIPVYVKFVTSHLSADVMIAAIHDANQSYINLPEMDMSQAEEAPPYQHEFFTTYNVSLPLSVSLYMIYRAISFEFRSVNPQITETNVRNVLFNLLNSNDSDNKNSFKYLLLKKLLDVLSLKLTLSRDLCSFIDLLNNDNSSTDSDVSILINDMKFHLCSKYEKPLLAINLLQHYINENSSVFTWILSPSHSVAKAREIIENIKSDFELNVLSRSKETPLVLVGINGLEKLVSLLTIEPQAEDLDEICKRLIGYLQDDLQKIQSISHLTLTG